MKINNPYESIKLKHKQKIINQLFNKKKKYREENNFLYINYIDKTNE